MRCAACCWRRLPEEPGFCRMLSRESGRDPFYYDYENPEDSASAEITIPTYPYGEGAALTVEKTTARN